MGSRNCLIGGSTIQVAQVESILALSSYTKVMHMTSHSFGTRCSKSHFFCIRHSLVRTAYTLLTPQIVIRTMSEDSSLQHLPANVDGLRARGGLSLGQYPVNKLLANKALLVAGEVILAVQDKVRPIPSHPAHRGRKGKGNGKGWSKAFPHEGACVCSNVCVWIQCLRVGVEENHANMLNKQRVC